MKKYIIFRFFIQFLLSLTLAACGSSDKGGSPISGPAIPLGIAATPGDEQITINWTEVTDATSYNIYYKESVGVTKTDENGESTDATYVHTELTNGTSYYYAVTAVNANGESGLSAEVSATPVSGMPNNFTVTPGNAQNILNWDNVTGAVKYNIYFANSTGVSKQSTKLTTTNSNSEFIHGPIENAITRYYRVAAVYADNSIGALSPELSGKPMLPVGNFTKTVIQSGTAGSGAGIFRDSQAEVRFMALYLADDVKGSGKITSISFKYYSTESTAVSCPNVTIKMGHTNAATLSTTFADNVETGQGSLQTVINGSTIQIPAGSADDYFTINLSQPFYYNGKDNLVIEIIRTTACSGDVILRTHDTAGYTGQIISFDSDDDVADFNDPKTLDAKFNFAGGDNNFVPQEGTPGSNLWPFNNEATEGRKIQTLVTKDEINGSGPITGIGFPVSATTTAQQYTVTIRLGHTTITEFQAGDSFNTNFTGTAVTVANNRVFKVPAGVPSSDDTFIWLPVTDGSFIYNNTYNLIVEIEVTDNSSATGDILWRTNTDYSRRVQLGGDLGADTGTGATNARHIKFRFAGGMTEVLTDGGSLWAVPYHITTDNKSQFLYHASELGTKGMIQKVAFRLNSTDSTQSNYPGYSITIGKRTQSTLTTTFADNMDNPQIVFSGTFSLPANLKKGDWIEIPLTYPFYYDLIENLVVQTSTLHGTSTNEININTYDEPPFSNRALYLNNSTGPTGVNYNTIADIRLLIE